jgi:hypothetical protein
VVPPARPVPGHSAAAAPGNGHLAEPDIAGLLFTAEMYGVQLDHLAVALNVSESQARALVARWRSRQDAESARLGPGPPWVWLTRRGLAACGLRYTAAQPALSRLAHLRAVTAVRLALQGTAAYRDGDGYWRSERRLRSALGGRVGQRDHLPDGEVHWPDAGGAEWAGECWAIEAELTAKTLRRTVAIMRELLARTGDYGCAAAQARMPGQPARHARVLYVCSAAALGTVARARDSAGPDGYRIEIRRLPPGASMAPAVPAVPAVPAARAVPPRSRPRAPA